MTLRAGCAVVVCTKDRPQQLRRCLDALEALDPPASEIIVVDNTTGDPAAARAARSAGAGYVD